LILTVLGGCSAKTEDAKASKTGGETQSAAREITDDAGRKQEIPQEINKVYGTSPIATILTYTLAPEKMAGWNYELRKEDLKYLLPETRTLPNLGGWQAKSTGNIEEILKAKPDVIISMGEITPTDVSLADKIQNQLNIPVVMVNLPLTEMDKAYILMGDLLGKQERAKELADYCRATIQDVKEKAARIPADKKVKVYYAEGAEGLQTEPQGSMHIQTLEIVGGLNVAADVATGGKGGQTQVSREQVLAWQPEVILTWNAGQGGAYKLIASDARWSKLEAVKQNKVYEIPNSPYNWFDRPPSVNRIIGFKWLGNLLYPDVYAYDMVKEDKDFYQLFYNYKLSDEEAKELLANSTFKK
jgi:iron complex transport system substrate-binding protein